MTNENDYSLFEEGDVNFSASRQDWYRRLDPTIRQLLDEDAEFFLHQSLSTPCLNVIESCEGIYITDVTGKKYMDFHGNNVHQLGYRNSYVLEKVKEQLDILPFSPRRYTNKPAIMLATKLASLLPGGLNRVLYAPGGTSAVGIALKIAKRVTGKHKVVSMAGSFHGASLDAIAVGGEEQFRKDMGALLPETIFIPQHDSYRSNNKEEMLLQHADMLEEIIQQDGQVCAFIAETIRNTDVQIPTLTFWKRIREICTRHHVLLILDEIPIAFGRTGKMFAFEHYAIEPDILCLGKGLGAGIVPFAAVVTRNEYNIAGDVSLGHYTHEKSPLGSVAALAMIEYLENEQLLNKVKEDEFFLSSELTRLKEKYKLVGDVRGIGMLWAIELVKDRVVKERALAEAEQVMYECLRGGLSFKVSQGNVLQLCAPLIITREELKTALVILESAFETVQHSIVPNN